VPLITDRVTLPRRSGYQPGDETRVSRVSAWLRANRGRRQGGLRRSLVAWDAFSFLAASLSARLVTHGAADVGAGRFVRLALAVVVWLLVFHAFGLYGSARVSAGAGLRATTVATAVGALVVSIIGPWGAGAISRSALAITALFACSLELVGSAVLRSALRRQLDGHLTLRTLLVGGNDEARRLARDFSAHVDGFAPIGALVAARGDWIETVPVVGTIEDVDQAIRRHDIDCVFIASTAVTPEQVVAVARACRHADVELRISANVSEILSSRLSVESNDGITSLAVKPVRLTGAQAAAKRTFDIVVSACALLFAVPFFAIIALAIRLTSPGPAFFRQPRVTKGDRVFQIVKFRSMVVDPERVLKGRTIDLTQPFFKLADDPRLTGVGKFLRLLSIDELPQLWNVLRGEMSLVGPRPLPLEQVEANRDFLAPRHEVRGGITGLWQISGRSDLDSEEALRIDRLYIENWSLGLDMSILAKTIGAVLARRGAM
jgi:exopolysaccharide biosynthesis polyprenyl glycosylphosphotransferase